MASIKCKKTLWRPGLCPGPRTRTSYNAIPYSLAGGEGLAAPFQEPHSRSRSFRPRALALHLLLWHDKDSRLAVYVCSIVVFTISAAYMQGGLSDSKGVRLSVRLSVTRVNCNKTNKSSAEILIPYER